MKLYYVIIIIVLLITLALVLTACANKQAVIYKWNQGELVEAQYSSDTGFRFWSEGQGKTIEISPSVNGVGL